MSQDLETARESAQENAREDLAFIRNLVESNDAPNGSLGPILLFAGALYGLQTLVQWAQMTGVIELSGPVYVSFLAGVTITFLFALGIVLWRDRNTGPKTVVGRAYEAAFQAAGLANLCIVIVIGLASWRTQSADPWLIYAPVVFALQGGAWFVAARLRKQLWLAAVAIGWFVSAIAMDMTEDLGTYILIASISLFGLMALPGWVMMKIDHQAGQG